MSNLTKNSIPVLDWDNVSANSVVCLDPNQKSSVVVKSKGEAIFDDEINRLSGNFIHPPDFKELEDFYNIIPTSIIDLMLDKEESSHGEAADYIAIPCQMSEACLQNLLKNEDKAVANNPPNFVLTFPGCKLADKSPLKTTKTNKISQMGRKTSHMKNLNVPSKILKKKSKTKMSKISEISKTDIPSLIEFIREFKSPEKKFCFGKILKQNDAFKSGLEIVKSEKVECEFSGFTPDQLNNLRPPPLPVWVTGNKPLLENSLMYNDNENGSKGIQIQNGVGQNGFDLKKANIVGRDESRLEIQNGIEQPQPKSSKIGQGKPIHISNFLKCKGEDPSRLKSGLSDCAMRLYKMRRKPNSIQDVMERTIPCPICPKFFKRNAHVESHLQTHFSERKKFACVYCGAKFSFKSGKRRHEKTHTGESLVNCEICGKQFFRTHRLNIHRIKRHPEVMKLYE